MDTLFVCSREAEKKKKREVYIYVYGDCFGMKGFLQSSNWFTISLSLSFGLLVPVVLSLSFSSLLHFPSPCIPFPVQHQVALLYYYYVGLIHSNAVLSGLFDFAVCAYVAVCAPIRSWPRWSPGTAQRRISSSSRLGTRKP